MTVAATAIVLFAFLAFSLSVVCFMAGLVA